MVETDVIVGKNGVHIDPVTRKFIKGGKPSTAIATSSQASELAKRKHERKREIMQAAAAAAVERDDYREKYGSDAWIAAIAEAQYIKATTPDDPKSTDAARFLFTETGLSEAKQAQSEGGGVTLHVGAEALQALAAWIGGDNSNYRNHEPVIDATQAQADEAETDDG